MEQTKQALVRVIFILNRIFDQKVGHSMFIKQQPHDLFVLLKKLHSRLMYLFLERTVAQLRMHLGAWRQRMMGLAPINLQIVVFLPQLLHLVLKGSWLDFKLE